MAILSDDVRKGIWAEAMQELSSASEPVGVVKADLRAAVNAMDAWLNDNASALNTAIPQPARGALTTAQKARLLRLVVRRRYEDGA